MDALGIFELGAKAGRAYVRAIRQAYRDALKPTGEIEYDYYASRLGRAEEGGEALEPRLWGCNRCDGLRPADDFTGGLCSSCVAYYAAPFAPPAAPIVESRMECESVDAAEPLKVLVTDLLPPHIPAIVFDSSTFPPVPSSSAGRGVGSPGVSAGAEEPAPPGGWPTRSEPLTFDELRAAAEYVYLWSQHPRVDDRNHAIRDLSERLKNAAWEIRAVGVGATPTPKPAEAATAMAGDMRCMYCGRRSDSCDEHVCAGRRAEQQRRGER